MPGRSPLDKVPAALRDDVARMLKIPDETAVEAPPIVYQITAHPCPEAQNVEDLTRLQEECNSMGEQQYHFCGVLPSTTPDWMVLLWVHR